MASYEPEYKSGGSIKIEENSLDEQDQEDHEPTVHSLPPSPSEEDYYTPVNEEQQPEENFKIEMKPMESREDLSLIEEVDEDSAMSSVVASALSPMSRDTKDSKQPQLCKDICQMEKKFI